MKSSINHSKGLTVQKGGFKNFQSFSRGLCCGLPSFVLSKQFLKKGNRPTNTFFVHLGSLGKVNTKEFFSEELCYKQAYKLIQSKFNKGYREVGEEFEVKESGMTDQEFWQLIVLARYEGEDLEEELELLIRKLSKKTE